MSDFHSDHGRESDLVVASQSDVGCVRTNNEDSFGSFRGADPAYGHLLIVADGMGGAAGGEVASQLAVKTIQETYFGSAHDRGLGQLLKSAVQRANQVIYERAASDPRLTGMGTTCTAAVIADRKLEIAHVGDSRAYLVRDGKLQQMTHDHSLAAELERCCSPGQAVPEAGRHVLTRCLGVSLDLQIDVTEEPLPLESDDVLVLCSDGLCGIVAGDDILRCASECTPGDACQQLIDMARRQGGPDNITVQIARLRRG